MIFPKIRRRKKKLISRRNKYCNKMDLGSKYVSGGV